jgi:hypothetical protein
MAASPKNDKDILNTREIIPQPVTVSAQSFMS